MINNLIKNIHWLEYALGLIVYFVFISNQQLSMGVIWLVFILYIWIITAFIIKQYSLQSFIYALSFLGIVISLTIFFMNGIEQVPFPRGAIQFKLDGIAQAIIIFFIFTLPLLLFNKQSETTAAFVKEGKDKSLLRRPPTNPISEKTQNSKIFEDEEWEEATIEDVESGKFETI